MSQPDEADATTAAETSEPRPRWRRWVWGWRPAVLAVGVFALMQLVPYRIDNPPVIAEPKWDSPRTRELLVRACFNCHSNETVEPWYGHVAPVSWWVTNHVNGGRQKLNFSEWDRRRPRRARDAIEQILEGSMPPNYYTWFGLHSEANLTDAEQAELVAGLRATLSLPENS